MENTFEATGAQLTVHLSGDLDHHAAAVWRRDIDERLFDRRPEVLVLDFTGVSFMDSSGIGLILGRAEAAGGIGCRVRLVGLSGRLSRLVRLSGVEKLTTVTVG